jgi:hypothetical protein
MFNRRLLIVIVLIGIAAFGVTQLQSKPAMANRAE